LFRRPPALRLAHQRDDVFKTGMDRDDIGGVCKVRQAACLIEEILAEPVVANLSHEDVEIVYRACKRRAGRHVGGGT
jgi:hypothetical protein